ncbi:methyl-accepting chemotaxis protein [Noviherbaspirillum sp. UKPF54]|uniref:methyl-accepting chemotaxis protein n=1 Tax=Noviherbaspirillum sp. UKPF54 TaxID=2601898 RepID=UPI0011B0F811|nr:methyl-accepting chemotaxis protein [Noviherbaspirillum sp. UKPF54]QDZ30079.1 HAMP domain-containing protein [Noviherbaspirillum sp. UKPF54]
MKSRISNRNIWVQLLLTIGVALLVVWSGVIVWQDHVYRKAAIEQANDFSLSMHDATMAGLTGMMVTGTVQQRDVFLDQVKQLGTIRDLRVIRGDAVSKVFGAGNAKDQFTPDEAELKVLQSGREVVQIESDSRGEYLRAVRPALAKKNSLGKDCTACHQVPENTVLGAVSMKLSLDHVNAGLAQQRLKSILAAVITCIPVLLLIYPFIHRVVTKPLEKGVQVARGIATGDLTQDITIDSHDEIGTLLQALKDMNDSLVGIVRQVREGSDAIYGASRDIASGNADLASRTELQAGSLDKTAASMERLTGAVRQNAEHARQANQLAESASEVAAKGGAAVARVVETMDRISESSRKIFDIIGVIDGIAFQTNILALNAAVEAARAGEQGRGFAVVASEVRNLAQRSAAAAKEIKALIGGSVEQVRDGTTLVHRAGATMQEVVVSIKHVTDIMGEIAAAGTEQTAGIEQVNQALIEMDAVTQQNAALVEQAAAASESLQDQAGQLERLVGVFKLAAAPASTATSAPASGPARRQELKLVATRRA